MRRIRVLVVEDSLTVRERLCEILRADPEITVVGQAADGKCAIELCAALRPDVISLDMMLPVMTGLSVTEYIMAHVPTPILIVSSSINRGELFRTYDALAAGAVDVLEKPRGDEPAGDWERRLIASVKLVSRIRVITHLRGRHPPFAPQSPGATPPTIHADSQAERRIVALGASTGGPRAIVEILRAIPAPYPLPVLLVVHLGEPFDASFAEWLDEQSEHRVLRAAQGAPMSAAPGNIILAPPGRHLEVRAERLWLSDAAERHSCRPSVDVLFESVAREYGPAAVACLLTGMGCDGAAGLLAIRQAGGFTLAQDEASSVVFGMPRAAIASGAACRVLPPREIGRVLANVALASLECGP